MALRLGVQGSGQLVGGVPSPAHFRDIALLAERLGYDSLWAGDHVSFVNPILDVTVALATFAAVTSRIIVGAGIILLPLVFDPAVPTELLAEQVESLAHAVHEVAA